MKRLLLAGVLATIAGTARADEFSWMKNRIDNHEARIAALEAKTAPKATVTNANTGVTVGALAQYTAFLSRLGVWNVRHVMIVGPTPTKAQVDPLGAADVLVVPSGFKGYADGVYDGELVNGKPFFSRYIPVATGTATPGGTAANAAPAYQTPPPAARQEWYAVPGVGPRLVTVVPAGHHAHYDSRGNVVVHNNNQNGVPGAHAGLNPTRIAEAGQTIPGGAVVTGSRTYAAPVQQTAPARFRDTLRSVGDGCPKGGCGRQGLFTR